MEMKSQKRKRVETKENGKYARKDGNKKGKGGRGQKRRGKEVQRENRKSKDIGDRTEAEEMNLVRQCCQDRRRKQDLKWLDRDI
jgi:hypothetical protein